MHHITFLTDIYIRKKLLLWIYGSKHQLNGIIQKKVTQHQEIHRKQEVLYYSFYSSHLCKIAYKVIAVTSVANVQFLLSRAQYFKCIHASANQALKLTEWAGCEFHGYWWLRFHYSFLVPITWYLLIWFIGMNLFSFSATWKLSAPQLSRSVRRQKNTCQNGRNN